MSLNPESAWRAPAGEPYVLKKSDSVFIAVPSDVDSKYAGIARTLAIEFGLVPFLHVGLDSIDSSQAATVHREALGDLYKCQAAVSIVSSESHIEDDWIFAEISSRHSWGVAVLVYELEVDKNRNRVSDHRRLFPSDVKMQIIHPDALEDALRNDLSILSSVR